jgi:hypothetical protein
MRTSHHRSILLLAVFAAACDPVVAPDVAEIASHAVRIESHAVAMSSGPPHAVAAAGTFAQTGITSLEVRQAGPNTILEQTSFGTVSGTLGGSYTDQLRVVIHPDGDFNAQFTIRCECTVAGEQGVLELTASDRGRLVTPTLGSFAGRAVITSGSGALSGLRGVLEIEGTVDLVSGLSTYAYSGRIH